MAKDTVLELCLRLNKKEADKLCADAKQCGLKRNAYLRRLIMGAPLKARPAEPLKQLYTEVNRLGNNVNQIARKLNQGLGTKEDISTVTFLLRKIYEAIEKKGEE